jgi:carboxymethylenebutenolidase
MGEIVEFPVNGTSGTGYLATPASGSGPGVLVIQEWWGLVPHIMDVCDRFAEEGFTALAPDLFGGRTTTEPDEAGKFMMALNVDQAAKDLRGGIGYLTSSDAVTSAGVGVVGFCMGGGLALVLACNEPDDVVACVPFYGVIPWENAAPDYGRLRAPVRGHYAEQDGFFGPAMVRALEQELVEEHGKDVVLEIHEGVDHAFFNDARPEVYHPAEAQAAWASTIAFLRDTVR